MTIAPALVRASVLILIHPGLRGKDKTTVLRMSILQKVIVVSSLLSFPITFVSMCIVNQHQQDVVVTILIILYWTLPPSDSIFGIALLQSLPEVQHPVVCLLHVQLRVRRAGAGPPILLPV